MFDRILGRPIDLSEELLKFVGQEPPMPIDPTSGEIDTSGDLTFRQKFRALLGAGREDFRQAGWGQKVGLVATAAWLAYEWGPGNETATPVIGGFVLSHFDGPAAPIATGLGVGLFTYAQQRASGATTAYTATTFPRLAETAHALYNETEGDAVAHKDWQSLDRSTKFTYAFGIGSTFSVTREAAVTRKSDFQHLEKVAERNARISGTAVAGIGVTAGMAKWAAEGSPAEHASDVAIGIIENPLTWLGLFSTVALAKYAKRKMTNKTV